MKILIAAAVLSVITVMAIPAHAGPIDPFPPDPCAGKYGKDKSCPITKPIVSLVAYIPAKYSKDEKQALIDGAVSLLVVNTQRAQLRLRNWCLDNPDATSQERQFHEDEYVADVLRQVDEADRTLYSLAGVKTQ